MENKITFEEIAYCLFNCSERTKPHLYMISDLFTKEELNEALGELYSGEIDEVSAYLVQSKIEKFMYEQYGYKDSVDIMVDGNYNFTLDASLPKGIIVEAQKMVDFYNEELKNYK